jgi:arginase family enzyme
MSAVDLSIYFQPLVNDIQEIHNPKENTLGALCEAFLIEFPDWKEAKVAIIGVNESRFSADNNGCKDAPDSIRKFLYKLYPSTASLKIVDFGNIAPGDTVQDTYFALKTVVKELIKHKVVPVILGGGQDLTFANYAAYESLEQTINLLCVDRMFDLGNSEEDYSSQDFLNKIILHEPNFLFNYSNIGYQTYFVDDKELQLMDKLFFDTYRLGSFMGNVQESEPIIRNADMVSFDISVIRQSDAPGSGYSSPNGLYGEDACQMCYYAGMSDKLSSIGFYELNPHFDINGQTSHLVAQMVWCFLDGFSNRKNDFPFINEENYLKYRVVIKDYDHELVFFKSKKTDRWWLNVPYPPNQRMKFERHHLVPCSYNDFLSANNEDIPDKWWKTFQKLV